MADVTQDERKLTDADLRTIHLLGGIRKGRVRTSGLKAGHWQQ